MKEKSNIVGIVIAAMKLIEIFKTNPGKAKNIRYIRKKLRLITSINRKVKKGKITAETGKGLIDQLNEF